jgi:Predicted transmembrane transcriptional regulator (anti-sigma factor)
MKMLRRKHDLVCQQIIELITEYLDGTLPRSQRRRFEAHIAGCPHCTEYIAQMRTTIRLTGRLQGENLTPEMQDDFAEIYRRWRSEESR